MKSLIYHALQWPPLRPLAKALNPFRVLSAGGNPGLKGSRIVILAPHPDDDILACGGSIQLYRERGARVHCIYLTDGRFGNTALSPDHQAQLRESEAEAAARMVGAEGFTFLRFPDGQLNRCPTAVGRLAGLLREENPDAVFLPFFTDRHPDHEATARVYAAASRRLPETLCYAYSVGWPLPFLNVTVDVTRYADLKYRALAEHRSQVYLPELSDASRGLSSFYGYADTGARGCAEVFLACTSREVAGFGAVF